MTFILTRQFYFEFGQTPLYASSIGPLKIFCVPIYGRNHSVITITVLPRGVHLNYSDSSSPKYDCNANTFPKLGLFVSKSQSVPLTLLFKRKLTEPAMRLIICLHACCHEDEDFAFLRLMKYQFYYQL